MSPLRPVAACLTALLFFATSLFASAQSDTRIGLRNLAQGTVPFGNRFGAAVVVSRLQNVDNSDPIYPRYIASEYNMVEPENELKPAWIWQGPGIYNLSAADFLLGKPGTAGWAEQNSVSVRGHTLIYPNDQGYTNPTWLLANEASISPAQAKQYLSDYIHFIVGRYKGKIIAWDVVNECIDDVTNGNEYNLRNDFWYRKLGKDYLLYACQFAYEADPNAELYINDYNVESSGAKADRHLSVVQWLRSQKNLDGTPIRVGIGLQYHLSVNTAITPGDGYSAVMQRLQDQNIPFMITELDVSMPVTDGPPGIKPANPNDLLRQATVYRNVLALARRFNNCRGFQTWGAYDGASWIPWTFPGQGAALPADANYQPKAAYLAMQEELGRYVADGISSIATRGSASHVLSIAKAKTPSLVSMTRYTGKATQKWYVLWNEKRGTYRIAPFIDPGAALDTYLWKADPMGGLQTYSYWNLGNNQEWLILPTDSGFYRISPRPALLRCVGTNVGISTNLLMGIVNFDNNGSKQWQFQKR